MVRIWMYVGVTSCVTSLISDINILYQLAQARGIKVLAKCCVIFSIAGFLLASFIALQKVASSVVDAG